MIFHKKYSAFTLVELIVVMTILAILGTIAFVSFSGFQVKARDSKRVSDLGVIMKGLELFKLQDGYFPDPSESIDISYSGALVWKQGSFGDTSRAYTQRISESPLDPLTKNHYAYAITYNKQEYEIASIYEQSLSYTSPGMMQQSYAQTPFFTKILGNYNKKIITLSSESTITILGVPTLITSEIQNVDVRNLYTNNSFAPEGGKNIPASYNNTKAGKEDIVLINDLGFVPGAVFNTTAPILYEGSIENLSGTGGKISFAENLIRYYKNSNISGDYSEIIEKETQPLIIVNELITGSVGGLNPKVIALSELEPYTPSIPPPSGGNEFITNWDSEPIRVDEHGSVVFNIESAGNVSIDWGDGTIENRSTGLVDHIYPDSGNYQVKITGPLKRFYFYADDTPYHLLSVTDWGNMQWTSMENMFTSAQNLTSIPSTPPDMSQVSSTAFMFEGAYQMNPDVSNWDVSNVTNMQNMFSSTENFNRNLSSWDVSNVTNMNGLFYGSLSFNGNISSWNVANVTDMGNLFNGANAFNQNISGWNVANVTNMENMFLGALAFNQNIAGWNVANVTSMGGMFWNAENFNQNIGGWNVTNVTNMDYMFNSAYSFNQNIGAWNVANVTSMYYMFQYASSFNQNIGGWDVGNVTYMDGMFAYNGVFNQDLSAWNVINVSTYSEFDISGAPPYEFDLEANSWVLPRPDFY